MPQEVEELVEKVNDAGDGQRDAHAARLGEREQAVLDGGEEGARRVPGASCERRFGVAVATATTAATATACLVLVVADGDGVLHLEYAVLAEVDEHLELLLVVAGVDDVVEELALGLLDLRFVPLLDVGLLDLEVDALDAARAAGDLDAAEIGLEVVEEAARLLHEAIEARVVAHVLAEVGEEHGHVEADVLGGLVEAARELLEVDAAVGRARVRARQHVVDLLARVGLLRLHGAPQLHRRDPAVGVVVELFVEGEQVLDLEEDVEELEEHLDIRLILDERVDHLLADRSVEHVALEHREQHGDHVLLQVHEVAQQLRLARILAQLVLQVGEYVEEAADGVPEARVSERELIAHARALYELGESVEDLRGDRDGATEVLLARLVHRALARVRPVEVHDGLLQAQQVVHRAYDRVHCRVVAQLGAQVVLKLEVVALAQQLHEAEERAREVGVVQVALARRSVVGGRRRAAELLGLDAALERVQVEHAARVHEARQRGEEAHVALLAQMVQHALLHVHVAAVQQRDAELQSALEHVALLAARRAYVQQAHLARASLGQTALLEQQLLLLHLLLFATRLFLALRKVSKESKTKTMF